MYFFGENGVTAARRCVSLDADKLHSYHKKGGKQRAATYVDEQIGPVEKRKGLDAEKYGTIHQYG